MRNRLKTMRAVPVLKDAYFDYAASTAVHPEILKLLMEFYPKYYANAEALHGLGIEIHSMMDQSKEAIAKLLKVTPKTLVFTSGATESNNILVKGLALKHRNRGQHLICSKIEHASVLDSFRDLEKNFGFEVTYLEVTQEGFVDPETLKKALRNDTILVSIMAVNNETGVIQKTQAYASLLKDHQAYFHVDMVQAFAKCDFDLKGIDAASFSAHKIEGVKGSGLLYLKENVDIQAIITGGQQEYGLRPGTANAIHHILLAKTMRLALEEHDRSHQTVRLLQSHLIEQLKKIEGISVNVDPALCTAYIVNISCTGLPSQVLLNHLSQNHIYVSSAAACSTKTIKHSHVLEAMGLKDDALKGVLRISLSHRSTQAEIEGLIKTIEEGIQTYARV